MEKDTLYRTRDWVVIVMVTGLIALLVIIVVGDYVVAFGEGRPIDASIVHLLQMSITGMVGIIAGYISGNPKTKEKNKAKKLKKAEAEEG